MNKLSLNHNEAGPIYFKTYKVTQAKQGRNKCIKDKYTLNSNAKSTQSLSKVISSKKSLTPFKGKTRFRVVFHSKVLPKSKIDNKKSLTTNFDCCHVVSCHDGVCTPHLYHLTERKKT